MTDGYTQTYDSGEVSEVAVDTIIGIGAALFSFVTLIALVLLYTWLKRRI